MAPLGRPFRTTFNAWEMDENAHLNVRQYFDRFDLAHRFLRAETPSAFGDGARLASRHVRYHAELRGGPEPVEITTDVCKAPDGTPVLCHVMALPETGKLSATGVDVFAASEAIRPATDDGIPELAGARGLAFGPAPPPMGDLAALERAGARPFHHTIVAANDCDGEGHAFDRFYVGLASDAVPHVWSAAGITAKWLADTGAGRIAVEAKISYRAGARVGRPVVAMAQIARTAPKLIVVRYDIFDLSSGACAATVEVVGMLMDLTLRRVMVFPDFLPEKAQGLMLTGG